jgi:alanyl-tRNA synthetase
MTSSLLRGKFFAFFAQRGCALIPAAPLVPENDPSALFVSAGMQPLVPYLLGERHPAGRRLANAQRCVRTDDIELVGDAAHLTFFEMLGNWSLGDYFKAEMIPWSWEFLTGPEWLGLDPQRLCVTAFGGDERGPRDEETIELWQAQFSRAGIAAAPGERIFPMSRGENWWGPVGASGPCGPDTEMFYDTGRPRCSAECRPNCGCGKYVEVWNDVFMEYEQLADGSIQPLAQRNVDTGMGVERTAAALNCLPSVFEGDIFAPLMARIVALSGRDGRDTQVSRRILADHVRAAAHLIADGVVPSNVEQGYVVRRLIRRAVRHGRLLGLSAGFWQPLLEAVAATHPTLYGKAPAIAEQLGEEQVRFERTLERGLREFDRLVAKRSSRTDGISTLGGEDAFELFATYGFPLEMTCELARERGLQVDREGFHRAFDRHQERSREGAEARFAGGLADRSEPAVRYHTATHLLHESLRRVLGSHVEQRGSHIDAQRLRFDFSHPTRLAPEQLRRVEELVNEAIRADYPIAWQEMDPEEARRSGAIGLFPERYGAQVRVYAVGGGADQANEPWFSREICGGPHVTRTGELGTFRIQREQSAGSGVRRIRAVLE